MVQLGKVQTLWLFMVAGEVRRNQLKLTYIIIFIIKWNIYQTLFLATEVAHLLKDLPSVCQSCTAIEIVT